VDATTSPATPTQTTHPWRATVRTVFAAIVALATLLPYAVAELNVPVEGVVAQALTIAAGVTRVIALPRVNDFITEYVPWLAPTPRQP
jgi:hypothetical protein